MCGNLHGERCGQLLLTESSWREGRSARHLEELGGGKRSSNE